MNYKVGIFFWMFFCFGPVYAFAQSEAETEALQTMLGKWEIAWNDGEVEKLIDLYHPDHEVRKAYESDDKAKESITRAFTEVFKIFGTFDEHVLGKYIERKKYQVVKITYSKKGLVPGTWRLKKHEGTWLIKNFNIDGESEPELGE